MRSQKIITREGKDFLVLSVPFIPETFVYGFVSKSNRSFVYRKWNFNRTVVEGYVSFRINQDLVRGRIMNNAHHHKHSKDIVSHEFNGILIPCVEISISKNLDRQND